MNPSTDLASAIERLSLGRLGDALRGVDAYLVGGVARSLIAGGEPDGDIDVAIVGELDPLLDELDDAAHRHERFGTAVVPLDGGRHVDLARTRTETYRSPGALPTVAPAGIEDDLRRRDFTVNAIAIALRPPHPVLDPFDGEADLRKARLRVLHPDSFRDDPTRAIRAARYCARLDLEPERETLELLAAADLNLLSEDRREGELARLAAEPTAATGFAMLDRWSVVPLEQRRLRLITSVAETAERPAWSKSDGVREASIMTVVRGGQELDAALRLADERPERPSEAVGAVASASADRVMLLIAAAAGAAWVETYLLEWSRVALVINGDDLIAAEIAPGPPVGAGLRGALDLKLDGELGSGREAELEAAVRIARAAI